MSLGNHPNDLIVIDDDSDDADGGMQVDFSSGRLPQREFFGYDSPDQHHHRHHHIHHHHHIRGSPSTYHTSIEQEKKVRSRIREERHAALSVLMDRELLMIQSLAAQETLPQTRRRFQAKLIAPDDPDIAAAIRADRFIIQHQHSSLSGATTPMPVQRNIVDVCESDDAGWMGRPSGGFGFGGGGGGGGGGSSGPSTPGSSKGKGGRTPDRMRGKARASSSRHYSSHNHHHQSNQQQNRERDRRRRWSGAERDDGGFAVQRFSP